MFELYLLFFISLLWFINWLKSLCENHNTKRFYDWISYLIYGIFWLLWSITTFILWYSNWVSLYIFIPMFLLGWWYWLFFKNKIKNWIFYRIDSFAFIIWIILLIDFILYIL